MSIHANARGPALPRRRTPPGAAPGTLVPDPAAAAATVHVISFSEHQLVERAMTDVAAIRALVEQHPVTWIDVQGLADIELIRALGDAFGLHRLALEDVVNVHQRPKVETFAEHLFIVTRNPLAIGHARSEQVAMFLGERFVITFQERGGDHFAPVRARIRSSDSRIRQRAADYLGYALLDAGIDAYFPLLEAFGERVEEIETAVLDDARTVSAGDIHAVKRNLLELRRTLWPLREMCSVLLRDESPLLGSRTRVYLRDCYDHTVQLMDMVETYREVASGLIELYLSRLSSRMNEVMRLLTVIATIFMPLGFVAAVYGMNFDPSRSPWNMPELGWYYGYPWALGVMGVTALAMLASFRRRGWIGGVGGGRSSASPGTRR